MLTALARYVRSHHVGLIALAFSIGGTALAASAIQSSHSFRNPSEIHACVNQSGTPRIITSTNGSPSCNAGETATSWPANLGKAFHARKSLAVALEKHTDKEVVPFLKLLDGSYVIEARLVASIAGYPKPDTSWSVSCNVSSQPNHDAETVVVHAGASPRATITLLMTHTLASGGTGAESQVHLKCHSAPRTHEAGHAQVSAIELVAIPVGSISKAQH